MIELFLDVANRSEPTKSLRLQAALREAVRSGRIVAGDRLPSSRLLATDLGWARNVVVDAYDQLNAEGYLVARAGDGTRVAPRPIEVGVVEQRSTATESEAGRQMIRIDLQPGLPDLAGFPVRDWRRSMNRAFSEIPIAKLGYVDGEGAPVLRAAVAGHLARTRAIGADPANVLVTTGVSASLRLQIGRAHV